MTSDPLDALYAGQKESLIKRYGKRIAGGMACSVFVAVVMHLPYIKVVILWVCQIVLFIFGRPEGVDKIKDKIAPVMEKGREAVKDGALRKALAPVKAVEKKLVEEPVKIAMKNAADTAVKKIEPIKEKAEEGVKVVKDTGHEVVGALKGVGERTTHAVGGLGTSLAEMAHARAKKHEEEARDRLIVRAHAIHLDMDESWSVARLEAEVVQAEHEWSVAHGPNSQCPFCHTAIRITSRLTENQRCGRCGGIFSRRTARQLGPPAIRRTR